MSTLEDFRHIRADRIDASGYDAVTRTHRAADALHALVLHHPDEPLYEPAEREAFGSLPARWRDLIRFLDVERCSEAWASFHFNCNIIDIRQAREQATRMFRDRYRTLLAGHGGKLSCELVRGLLSSSSSLLGGDTRILVPAHVASCSSCRTVSQRVYA